VPAGKEVATDIALRPARPADAPLGGPLVYLSGPTVFDYSLARPAAAAEQVLIDLWPYPRHLFSYQWARVAAVSGHVQGLLLGYRGAQLLALGLATARLMLRRFPLRELAAMAVSGSEVARLSSWVGARDFYIAHVAVMPGAQGQGIGRLLLADAERHARIVGCTRCTLDVFAENHRARAVYAHMGYEVKHRAQSERLRRHTGYSAVLRMARPL
jgi:ribosomal protein S18 acetylase RimI-like enzyme